MASKIAAEVLPLNGRVPVAISYKRTPKEKRSVRGSNSLPRVCSGDIYATVPSVLPGLVKWSGSTSCVANVSASAAALLAGFTLARPKSKILACPLSVRKIFAGLMSRWTMPFECAAFSPSATCIATSSIVSNSNGRPEIMCFRVLPSRYSMAMNALPFSSPMS
jgi:hypothetical protein